jgi:peptidoglycan/xylan/chitin deacetylase (PgdA/CDA1 family)
MSSSYTRVNRAVVDGAFLEHYRCPDHFAEFEVIGHPSVDRGYYRLGPDIVCYGPSAAGARADRITDHLYDAMQDVTLDDRGLRLPFSPHKVIAALRHEQYISDLNGKRGSAALAEAYYLIRPLLAVSVRKHLQRAVLKSRNTSFPKWPVDTTVERIFEKLMLLSLKRHGVDRIPFVWFWPDGLQSCVVMTHDVETAEGQAFVPHLMDLDEAYGIRASFQIVPEGRYDVSDALLQTIRERGFEVAVHDLNHDGRLFSSREEFDRRVLAINRYGRAFQAEGFRSAVLYRRLDWFGALDFCYDMSIPNAGHLEAQRGGCCSIMPFFEGQMVELPVTTTQDYSLFHILGDYSIDLWKRQIATVAERHGMASFIVHPDYVTEPRARGTYERLLDFLTRFRSESHAWCALPRQVASWWRQRNQMTLAADGDGWKVVGLGSERARVAYATLGSDKQSVVYRLQGLFAPLPFEEALASLSELGGPCVIGLLLCSFMYGLIGRTLATLRLPLLQRA